jgi:hypothetical protein
LYVYSRVDRYISIVIVHNKNGELTVETINWEAVQAISETLGLLIVVGSLIYVGLEVRQNAKATRAATMNNIMSNWGEAYRGLSESENVGTLIWKGVQDVNNLEGADRWRFSVQIVALFHNYQNAHYQWSLGLYDAGAWAAQSKYLANLMSLAGVHSVWEERSVMFSKDFQDYMESVVISASVDGNYSLVGA